MFHSEALPPCDWQKHKKACCTMLTEFTAKADILNKIIRSCMELNFNPMPELQKQFKYVQYF